MIMSPIEAYTSSVFRFRRRVSVVCVLSFLCLVLSTSFMYVRMLQGVDCLGFPLDYFWRLRGARLSLSAV